MKVVQLLCDVHKYMQKNKIRTNYVYTLQNIFFG